MSGEQLKRRIKELGISQAELARRLNVIPEAIAQALKAKDVKSGFLEDLCRVLGKDMSFFYGGVAESKPAQEEKDTAVPYFIYRDLQDRCEKLIRENQTLRDKLSNEF